MEVAALGLRIDGVDGIDRARDSLGKLAKSAEEAQKSTDGLGLGARKAGNGINETAKSSNDATKEVNRFAGAAKLAGAAVVATFSVDLIKSFSFAIYEASAAAERLRIGLDFSSAIGSAAEISYLREVTQRLGLEFSSTATAYQHFSAAARGTALEGEKARDIFESIAKSSAVMGLSAANTSGVLLAMQQMISKGTVQSEELRGQLGERLPGAFQTAARAMGVTTAELGKMLEQGQVLADDFLPKFARELDRSLGDSAENAANRLDASSNRINNAWDRIKQNVGESGVTSFMAGQMNILADAMANFNANVEAARASGGGFTSQLLAGASAAIEFLNPINAISYSAAEAGNQLKAAEQRLEELRAAGGKTSSNLMLREAYAHAERLVQKLKEAKRAQNDVAGGGLASAYTEGMGNSRAIAKQAADREDVEKRLLEISSRQNGITKQFTEDMATYEKALASGIITEKEYVSAVTAANKKRYEATEAGKEAAKAQRELNKASKGSTSGVSELAGIMARVQAANEYLKALKEQGKTADKITEGERLAWKIQQEIDSGKLKSSQLVQKQKELEAAKQLQASQEALQAEEKRIKQVEQNKQREIALANYQFQIQERLTASQQRNEAQLGSYGQGARAAQESSGRISLQQQQQQELRKMANEHAQEMRKSETASERDHLQKMYADRLAITQSAYASEMSMYDEFLMQKREKEANWQLGFDEAMQNFVDKSQNMYALAEQSTTAVLGSMQSSISSSFMSMLDGTKSVGDAFTDMAHGMSKAVIQALIDMAAQWLVYQGVQLIVGKTTGASASAAMTGNAYATATQAGLAAFASTAAIPIVGPALAPAAMATALGVTMPMAAAVSALSLSGMAHDGIDSIPATGTWLLEKGERVTTANTSAKMDSVLERIDSRQRNGQASGAVTSSAPVVNVIEDASKAGQIETMQDNNGGYSTSVFVRNIRGGGDEAQALEVTYGLTRRGR